MDQRHDAAQVRLVDGPGVGQIVAEAGGDEGSQLLRRHLPDVDAVHPLELVDVEDRPRLPHAVEREILHKLLAAEDLGLVVVRPAQQRQEVHQRLGQESLFPVVQRRGRPVALAQLRPVGPQDDRQMRVDRRLPAQGLVEQDVARRARYPLVAADDVGDPHGAVVDDVRQMVGGKAVRLQEHEVVEQHVAEADLAAQQVVADGLPLGLGGEPDDLGAALGLVAGAQVGVVAVAAVVFRGLAPLLLLFPHRGELVRRAVAGVGLALPHQTLGRFVVALEARWVGLKIRPRVAPLAAAVAGRPLVPVEAEPAEALQDRLGGALDEPRLIGVLDADDEGAAAVPREEPVEERGADVPHVRNARGAGGVADADGVGHGVGPVYSRAVERLSRAAPCEAASGSAPR